MYEFGPEFFVLIIFGIVIILLLFLIYLLQRRVNQLLNEVDDISSTMNVTCSEIEELTKNVQEIKKLKI